MSQRQLISMNVQRKKSDRQMKFLTVNSKSRQKSQSGDQKKSQGSLKKIFYKHQIFDKRNSAVRFKPLNRIKEEQTQPVIQKYRSSEQLNWKDKVISILQKQQAFKNDPNGKNSQRSKLRSNSSKSGSKDNSLKNIQILQIQHHQIVGQGRQSNHQEEQKLQKGLELSRRQKASSHQKPFKQQNNQKHQKKQQKLYKQQLQTQTYIITVQKHAFNRDQQIIQHKYQSNLKYLITQTNDLLSYNKHMILQEQLAQTKKRRSQINIAIRRYRIEMRNHEYTKEINFTFPVEKHNDQIMVRMPDKVEDREMSKYYLLVDKLQKQAKIFIQQQQKISNLQAYYQTLTKKYQPFVVSNKIVSEVDKLSGTKQSFTNGNNNNKLTKSKSSQNISIKSSSALSSLASMNSRSPIKNVVSQFKLLSPTRSSQREIQPIRYHTLIENKHAIKDSIQDMKTNMQVKTLRLIEQINLLKKEVSLIDSNINNTQQNKLILHNQIYKAKNNKPQKQQNVQKHYQTLTNNRRKQYHKQKITKNIQTKGFTLFLRSNKSLSPVNYLSTPSNKISTNHSPRDMKALQLNKVIPQQLSKRKNIENVQSAKLIKLNK